MALFFWSLIFQFPTPYACTWLPQTIWLLFPVSSSPSQLLTVGPTTPAMLRPPPRGNPDMHAGADSPVHGWARTFLLLTCSMPTHDFVCYFTCCHSIPMWHHMSGFLHYFWKPTGMSCTCKQPTSPPVTCWTFVQLWSQHHCKLGLRVALYPLGYQSKEQDLNRASRQGRREKLWNDIESAVRSLCDLEDTSWPCSLQCSFTARKTIWCGLQQRFKSSFWPTIHCLCDLDGSLSPLCTMYLISKMKVTMCPSQIVRGNEFLNIRHEGQCLAHRKSSITSRCYSLLRHITLTSLVNGHSRNSFTSPD
jgi:hypothetical protein